MTIQIIGSLQLVMRTDRGNIFLLMQNKPFKHSPWIFSVFPVGNFTVFTACFRNLPWVFEGKPQEEQSVLSNECLGCTVVYCKCNPALFLWEHVRIETFVSDTVYMPRCQTVAPPFLLKIPRAASGHFTDLQSCTKDARSLHNTVQCCSLECRYIRRKIYNVEILILLWHFFL